MSSPTSGEHEPPLLVQPGGLTLRLPPPKAGAPKKTWQQQLAHVVVLLIGGAFGGFGAHYGIEAMVAGGSAVYQLAFVALLPVVWLGVVGWHELGHLVGGWAIGGRFLFWVAGPVMVRRTPAGIRLMLNRSVNLTGGMAACLPENVAQTTPRRMAVMIVAGPVSSLVQATLALWAAAFIAAMPGVVPPGWALLQHLAVTTAGVSLFIFLITALPGVAGGFKTDGKRVMDLLRGDHRSDQESAVIGLTAAALAGIRPADYDPALVRRALALNDGSLFDLYGHLHAFYHAADQGRWPEAQRHLDHIVTGEAQLVPYVRDSVRCEYAWLLAVNGGTGAGAAPRAWLDSAGKLDFDRATRLRAEAAVLLAEGKSMEAAARAKEGLVALQQRSMSPVVSPFSREALEALVRRAGG